MSWLLDRLLMWIADALDRNLVTVPDLDDDWPRANGLTCPPNMMTASEPIQLNRGRRSVVTRRLTPTEGQHRN
jgi:hypothetical protein